MDKTQFVWLGTPHQRSKLRCQAITFGSVNIQISTEAMCLGVLLDSALTFAPHARRLASKSFYHLRQMKTVRRALTEDAAKTMVYTLSLLVGSTTVIALSIVLVRTTSSPCGMY